MGWTPPPPEKSAFKTNSSKNFLVSPPKTGTLKIKGYVVRRMVGTIGYICVYLAHAHRQTHANTGTHTWTCTHICTQTHMHMHSFTFSSEGTRAFRTLIRQSTNWFRVFRGEPLPKERLFCWLSPTPLFSFAFKCTSLHFAEFFSLFLNSLRKNSVHFSKLNLISLFQSMFWFLGERHGKNSCVYAW